MKPLLAAIFWTLFNQAPDTFLIVDKNLKKPALYANNFTTELYLQRNFPVYAGETQDLIEVVDNVVKKLDKGFSCNGLEKTGTAHTSILVEKHCNEIKSLRIVLITQLEGTNTSFSFVLVPDEAEVQTAQRKLLDFATYINR